MGSRRGKRPRPHPTRGPGAKKRARRPAALASKEEVLSANEELQSINEELETAKEELQSSNEEMATLNQELQDRNRAARARARLRERDRGDGARSPAHPGRRLARGKGQSVLLRLLPGHARRRPSGDSSTSWARGSGTSPRCGSALEEVLPKDARFEDFEVAARIPGDRPSDAGVQRPQAASRPRPRRASSSPSRTRPRSGRRKKGARRCWAWSIKRGSGPRMPTGSRTSSWRRVSHELRGPLSAMVGWVHILRDERIDDAPGSVGERPSSGVSGHSRGSSRSCWTTRAWSRASFSLPLG